MAAAADEAGALPRGRAVRARLPYLEVAAGLTALWVHGACAQSDPAFSATPSQTNSQAPASTGTADPAAAAAGGAGLVLRAPSPLRANTPLQPFTGSTAQGGGLRDDAASSLSAPLDRAARNWTITPSLGLGEEYSSSVVASSGSGSGSDFITLVQPGISASGATTRLQGSLSYNPEVDIYARHFSQTRVNQNFGGNVLAVLLPGTVFLDLRAFGGVTSNGFGGNSTTNTGGNNLQTQTLAFSASPFAVQRFGDVGSAEIGVSLSRSSASGVNGNNFNTINSGNGLSGFNGLNGNNGLNGINGVNNQGFVNNPYFNGGDQRSTTYGAHAGFQTGEAFDRYNGLVLASLSQSQGSGVLSRSARDTFTIDNGYGVTRLLTLLARVGYEHIRYSGTTPVRIDDEILTAGFRLSLGPSSKVQVTYGHQDGFNSLSLIASVEPTARTRLETRYSEGLDTDAEQLQNGLATADFDQLGNPVDHTSGTPLLLGTSGFFGAQNNLYKTRRLSATGTLLQDVDTFSLSINAEDNRLVSSSGLPNQLGSNQGVYGSLNWSHEISPTLSLNSFAQYGVRSAKQSGGTQHIISGSAALVKTLSETLSAQLRYSYNRNTGGQGFGIPGSGIQATLANGQPLSNYEQSVILLSAVKSF